MSQRQAYSAIHYVRSETVTLRFATVNNRFAIGIFGLVNTGGNFVATVEHPESGTNGAVFCTGTNTGAAGLDSAEWDGVTCTLTFSQTPWCNMVFLSPVPIESVKS